MGSYGSSGSQFMNVVATSVKWPSTGSGAVATSAATSGLLAASASNIESILVLTNDGVARSITLFAADGTTPLTIGASGVIPVGVTQAQCPFSIPLGGDAGLEIKGRGGFSCSTSNAALTFVLSYKRVE